MSMLIMIVRVNVDLNRTVVVQSKVGRLCRVSRTILKANFMTRV